MFMLAAVPPLTAFFSRQRHPPAFSCQGSCLSCYGYFASRSPIASTLCVPRAFTMLVQYIIYRRPVGAIFFVLFPSPPMFHAMFRPHPRPA